MMDGEPLAPEHGFPLRIIVPASPGCAARIARRNHRPGRIRSRNPMQQTDYKLFPPNVTPASVDWATGISVPQQAA